MSYEEGPNQNIHCEELRGDMVAAHKTHASPLVAKVSCPEPQQDIYGVGREVL